MRLNTPLPDDARRQVWLNRLVERISYMLDLNRLAKAYIPAITEAQGAMLAQAAGVCLESQGHVQNVTLTVVGGNRIDYTLTWLSISKDDADNAWNDEEYATEHGAVGIAILLIREETEYEVIQSSRRGTGFDYWLGQADERPFQRKARMEVSGIRQGDASSRRRRVQEKLAQMSPSDDMNLPGYAVVVEFGQPAAEIAKK